MNDPITIDRDDLRETFVQYFGEQFAHIPTAEDWYVFIRLVEWKVLHPYTPRVETPPVHLPPDPDGDAAVQRALRASVIASDVSHSISRMTLEEAMALATEIQHPDFIETYAAMKRQLQER